MRTKTQPDRGSAPTRLLHAPVLALALLASCGAGCAPPAENPGGGGQARKGAPDVNRPTPDSGSATDGGGTQPTPAPSGEMITEAKGVDLTKLTEAQRTSFFQLINIIPSACDKPHSIAKSIKDDAECRDSLVVGQYVSDRLASGATVADVKVEVVEVVDALKPRKIDTEGNPVYGNERAPVEVVVFADFECPHCRAEAPVLRDAVKKFRGQAKLIFKHYPLNMHPRAKAAAIACVAAHKQGKFWKMHDLVFANQTQLEEEDLRAYAKKIGLDMAQFEKDYADPKTKAAVEKDRADGDKLDITGTPAVYVNGRYYTPVLFGGTVEGWINDALNR